MTGADSLRPMHEINLILQAVQRGEEGADARLMRAVYDELRALAASKLSRETEADSLQPTALVHEAWLRLGADRQPAWQNGAHFFGAAAEAMRRILIEQARRRRAVVHGGGQERVTFEEADLASNPSDDERLLAMNEALDRFALIDPEAAQLVNLHYFAGMAMKDAANVLGVSESTGWRWWSFARAWLFRELSNP